MTVVNAVKRSQNMVPDRQDKNKIQCWHFCHHCLQLIFVVVAATASSLASVLPLYTTWNKRRNETLLWQHGKWKLFYELTITFTVTKVIRIIRRRPTVYVDDFSTSTACCDLDLYKLIRSSVGACEYSQSVLLKLFKAFMKYHSNKICLDKQMNVVEDCPITMALPTLWGGECIL